MPKGSRASTKKQTTKLTTAVELVKVSDTLHGPPRRPRTRAWTKLEAEGKSSGKVETPAVAFNPLLSHQEEAQFSKIGGSQLSPQQQEHIHTTTKTRSRSRHGRVLPVNKVLLEEQPPKHTPKELRKRLAKTKQESQRQDPARETTQQIGQVESLQGPSLATWIDGIESTSPESLPQPQAFSVPGPDHRQTLAGMDSSSTSRGTRDDGSTVKLQGSRSVKLSETKLRLRRVKRDPTADSRIHHLRSILKTKLPERQLEDIEELRSITETFLQQMVEHPNDSCYTYIDEFSYSFDKGKANINYPAVNRRYFESDLKRCLARNEAVLQRTIMIHIINQYWLGKIFDWNSEGQWIQPKDTRLPSREDDDVSLPKPDLAISFTLESFTGEEDDSAPIPADLERCISPDGGDRCFPFLFFEVKKAGSDLQEAYTANLHSSSQALYNIYNWMVRVEQEDVFFGIVRVFSVVFNAQDLSVRVHRAVKLPNSGGALGFQFDEFLPLDRYTKDQACLLINTILSDYAAAELHPLLKTAFINVVSQEDERVAGKRKIDAARNNSSKRARKNQADLQHTGQSFNMGSLST